MERPLGGDDGIGFVVVDQPDGGLSDQTVVPCAALARKTLNARRDALVDAVSNLADEMVLLIDVLIEERRPVDKATPIAFRLDQAHFHTAVDQARSGALQQALEVRSANSHSGAPRPGGSVSDTVDVRIVFAGTRGAESVEQRRVCPLPVDHAVVHVESPEFLVVDRSVALVATDATAPGGILVTSVPMVEVIHVYFDLLWTAAVVCGDDSDGSAEGHEAEAVSPVARRVLELLASGHRDTVAASLLGLSVRSVRRYVAQAANALNTRTRFSTGFHAYRKGWLEPS